MLSVLLFFIGGIMIILGGCMILDDADIEGFSTFLIGIAVIFLSLFLASRGI